MYKTKHQEEIILAKSLLSIIFYFYKYMLHMNYTFNILWNLLPHMHYYYYYYYYYYHFDIPRIHYNAIGKELFFFFW